MKKSELINIIKEELLKEESFNSDKNEIYRIMYNEDSYQFKSSYFIGNLNDAKSEANKMIKAQSTYRKPNDNSVLWATISEPTKWKEITRIK